MLNIEKTSFLKHENVTNGTYEAMIYKAEYIVSKPFIAHGPI